MKTVRIASFNFCASLCLFVAIASSAFAAPPTLTYLSPAGAQRGTTVDVTPAGTLDASTKVWASGKSVSVEQTKGKLQVTVAKDAVPGTYWLRAHNAEGASTLRPFVVGMLPEVTEKEPNDDFKKPHALDGSFTVNGKLEKSGDVDCFAVNLKKGQTLVAALEANRTLRSPMDAILQVLSSDGFVLEENNDFHGLDPQIAFTAKKDGTYIARVYAFPSTPDSSIRYFGSDACVYRLTLTTGAFADYAIPLALGPDRKSVHVEGWNRPPSLLAPPRESGQTSATLFDDRLANPLRLRAEPHPALVRLRGDRPTPAVVPPVSVSGRIETRGDTSQIDFHGEKGQPLSIQVESRSLGLAVNPVVRVSDAEGKPLARAEPGKLNGDTVLAFTPPADGVYALAVEDLYRGGGPRHAFLVRILSEPDYELTVAADRFALTPGKPTTVTVKVTRVRGFKSDVEVIAEGLPEGVKAEVTKPAKPDPNAVTLSLTAESAASGPFRVVGKVKDEPKLTRAARFALTEFEETTADLWLAPAVQEAPPKKKK
jgi:hypothetical protein